MDNSHNVSLKLLSRICAFQNYPGHIYVLDSHILIRLSPKRSCSVVICIYIEIFQWRQCYFRGTAMRNMTC